MKCLMNTVHYDVHLSLHHGVHNVYASVWPRVKCGLLARGQALHVNANHKHGPALPPKGAAIWSSV